MIERKSFTGGLSTDRDGAYIQPNQYLNALNIRVSSNEEGSEGALSNIKGNEKVSLTMPSGTNTCIGSFEDSENSRVFYFIHNTSSSHMILCYFHKEGVIRKVMQQSEFEGGESGLNFSASNLITGVGMNDDLLFFTDGSTEPKRINVERGLKKNDSSYTQLKSYDNLAAYGDLRDTHIALIRQSPTLPLTISRFKDTSYDSNLIKGDAFTFTYRFIYADGELSSLAPYSETSHRANPDTSPSETDNNSISVVVPSTQEIGNDVVEVEYLVKYNEETNFSVFFTEKNYDRLIAFDDDGQELSVVFRNDTTKLPVPVTDVTRYSSAVPVKAASLECARGRVFLGDTTEGLDNLNEEGLISKSAVAPRIQQSSGNLQANYKIFKVSYYESGGSNAVQYFRFIKVKGSSADGYYSFSSNGNPLVANDDEVTDWLGSSIALNTTRYPTSQSLIGQSKVAGNGYTQILDYVESLAPSGSTVQFSSELFVTGNKDTAVTITAGVTQSTITLQENLRLWKSSSSYKFAMYFSDRYGRQGRLIPLTDTEGVSIPSRGSAYANVVKDVEWSLPTSSAASYIPDWAHSFSFVRSKSLSKSFFLQFPIKSLQYTIDFDETATTSDTYVENGSKYIRIDLSSLSAEDLGYTYSEGDLITIHNLGGNEYTFNLVHQSGTFVYGLVDKSVGSLAVTSYVPFAEIFTPKLNDPNEPYFGFGESYAITNAGASNRTWATASGTFEGDVVVKVRQFGTGANINMQVTSANYQGANKWIQLTGRGFNTTRFQQVHKPTAVSFSENRLQGSLLNGLSTFNPLDESTLPQELGSIKKLLFTSKTESSGNTMLAIGSNETASVYIGEAQIQTSGGAAFLAVQTGVIGSAQVLRGSYGTLHPESVVEQNNRVYFLDALCGTVIQYDVNGLMPIGNKGVSSFFNERCDKIVVQGKTGCHGGFDPEENEYILTLPKVTDVDQEYLDDYIEELSNTDLLSGNQSQYNGLVLNLSVDVVKGRKYRVEIGDQVGLDQGNNSSLFDSITIKYSDNTSIGTTSTTDKGGFKEFVATQDSASLKFVIADSEGVTLAPADKMHMIVSEFRASYYKMDNGDALTLAYSEDIQSWTTFYSYIPENMHKVGTQFVSFKSGELWKHNVSDTRNNFYGVQYKSRIVSLSKQMPSAVKAFSTLAIEGDNPPSFSHFRTEGKYMDRTSTGEIPTSPTYSEFLQSSDLSDSDFRQYEGVYYAGILRNRLEPSPSAYVSNTYNENMIKGEKLINQFMLFTLEFDNTSKLKVRFADIAFNIQRGHKL